MDPLEPLLDLTRRLPPTEIEETIKALCALAPDLADDLLGSVDQPLQVLLDTSAVGGEKEFLCCDYNRDGDSFRSPWTNSYIPSIPESEEPGTVPSTKLRQLEVQANKVFDTYREMYYEGGISSTYFWDLEDGGFAGVVLFKKTLDAPTSSSWNSIHVFEASERGRVAHYKLTSTVMLQMSIGSETGVDAKGRETGGKVELGGSLMRQVEQDAALLSYTGHIPNLGRIIEDMEGKLRNLLAEVYFGKTKDVLNDVRSAEGLDRKKNEDALRRELMANMRPRA